MGSFGKVSGLVFVLLVNIICVLVHVLVGVHVRIGVIMCILTLNTCTCICSSVHSCGCVADGRDTMVLDFCVQTASG